MSGRPEERVVFETDGIRLEGRLALPAAAAHGAVLCHPHPEYGGTMDDVIVRTVARALQDQGVATLRFNFRGVGASGGQHSGGDGEVRDARAAVATLHARIPAAELALVGYSFGAIVALHAGHDLAEVSRLVAIAPPLVMTELRFLRACGKPVLFVVGERDQFCPRATLEGCLAALTGPKQAAWIREGDHFFSGDEAAVAAAVTAFMLRHSGAEEIDPRPSPRSG